jgi:Uma2 family endonuclease
MDWQAVIDNPLLQNLPFKIELNKWGKILMSPASNNHGRLQYVLGSRLERGKAGGTIIMECSVRTADGVKVADVAWASDAFIAEHGFQTPYSVAPEICVEITSPSNSRAEMEEKVQLYLAKGAKEVWVCDDRGQVRYYSHSGQLERSHEVLDGF